ncbi:MAG: Leucine-rich repeat (LRR) protein [Flavobacterium sp.]|jgi:Leucine-rich repeat (LRR) protein
MKNHLLLLGITLFFVQPILAQENPKIKTEITYSTYLDAVKNPGNITRLKLNNLKEINAISDWSKLSNIEYLSLENDHLKELPTFIVNLKKLKVIDLSGNDFKQLPKEFSLLQNLEEIYLNNEKDLDLPNTLSVLSKLPKLKTLHLENDNIDSLPVEILNLKNLEELYLTNNKLLDIPKIETLEHLKYLDLKKNKIKPELQDIKNLNFGFKITF